MIVVKKNFPGGSELIGPFESDKQADAWGKDWCTPEDEAEAALLTFVLDGPIWTVESVEMADFGPEQVEAWIKDGELPEIS